MGQGSGVPTASISADMRDETTAPMARTPKWLRSTLPSALMRTNPSPCGVVAVTENTAGAH